MQNCEVTVNGNILTFQVDISKPTGTTSRGDAVRICGTGLEKLRVIEEGKIVEHGDRINFNLAVWRPFKPGERKQFEAMSDDQD